MNRSPRVRRRGPRASQACEGCATAKARCDNNEVCQRCHQRQMSCVRPWPLAEDETQVPGNAVYPQADHTAHSGVSHQTPIRAPDANITPDLPRAGSDSAMGTLDGIDDLAELLVEGSPQNRQILQNSSNILRMASHIVGAAGQSNSPKVLEAYENTVGRWDPDPEYHRAAEEGNLFLDPESSCIEDHLAYPSARMSDDTVSSDTRDRILAMILHTCEPANMIKVVSAFPAANVLDRLLHRFYATHATDDDSWIHIPTLRSSEMPTELLGACITSAAMRSSSAAVRRFGTALHGVLHPYLFQIFEKRIAQTRCLQQIQALALIGCHREPMSPSIQLVIPDPADTDDVLESKWHHWVEQESWKRLVFHMHIHCSQESLVTGSRTPVSYAELCLSFPQSGKLWAAKTAAQWLRTYNQMQSFEKTFQQAGLREYLANPSLLQTISPLYDSNLARLIVLHAVGSMVKDHLQSKGLLLPGILDTPGDFLLADESFQNRVAQLLNSIRILHDDSQPGDHHSSQLTAELISMHSLTPFEQIEIIAGREGPEEAEAVLPLLERWCQSSQARKAVWHASQFIRYLHHLNAQSFTEFFAVGAYQASLCLCIYGTMAQMPSSNNLSSGLGSGGNFQIDGPDSPVIQRWIILGSGTPMLGSVTSASTFYGGMPLGATRSILLRVRDLLYVKASQKSLLPLVTGICDLLCALSITKQREPRCLY
ncbi:putative c2h2 type zinc finger domain protein [Aspergillus niger]|uniref:Putative c2h2 type zinc finger domain protein n=1 Tax=Aspergillus niger TaxID=5061 RepID=A0A117E140_ASPNG|nr:putative c2h2 type zinc finger domain protein [Aspergillus niger]